MDEIGMDDSSGIDQVAQVAEAADSATSQHDAASRWRRSLALRTGATAVVACGLAAGSYGIAAAASSTGAPKNASALAATASSPSTAKPSAPSAKSPRLGRPAPFGPLGGFGGRFGDLGQGGTVKSFTATTITVDTAFNGTITVTTNASTTYSKGGKTVTRSALATGEQVAFLPASRPTASSTSTPTLVRTVEIVLPHVSGKVISVNGSQVVVQQQDGLYVTVNVASSTAYDEAGQAAPSSAVVAGVEVSVTGTVSADHTQIDATTVDILLPSVAGQVTAVSGTTLTITGFDGTTETVTTGTGTVFRDKSGKTTIASVAKGDFVEAFGTVGSGSSFAAVTVDVGPGMSSGPAISGGPAFSGGPAGSGPFGGGRFGGRGGSGRPGGFGGPAGWGGQGGTTTGAGVSGASTTL
jgi:hypothetical protein